MHCVGRAALVAVSLLAVAPAFAQGLERPRAVSAHACLNQKERRAAIESGKIIQLAAAMRSARKRMQGSVVGAHLCHGKDGLIYVLTILARNGKVARLTIDASKGTLVGNR